MSSPCTLPASSLQLGPFNLLDFVNSPVKLNSGWDRGAPAPTVSFVQSSVLDGAAVIGRGSGNRSPSIPVTVVAPDRVTLAGIVNQLLAFVDQQTWTMTFTPAGGFPVVYDCYRATVTLTSPLVQDETSITQTFLINCQALPYGRSPGTQAISLTGSAPLVIDSFEAAPAPTLTSPNSPGNSAPEMASPSYVTTPTPPQGTHSLRLTLNPASSKLFAVDGTLSRSGLAIATTTDLSAVSLSLGIDGSSTNGYPFYITWTVAVTLTTSAGTFSGTLTNTLGNNSFGTFTVTLNGTLPAGSTITGWSLRAFASQAHNTSTQTYPSHVFFDQFIALPPTAIGVSDSQGAVVNLAGVAGTARTPAAVALQLASGATFASWLLHTPPPDTPLSQPLIPYGGAGGAALVSTQAGARFKGTYSVWICYKTIYQPGTARNITFFIGQSSGSFAEASLTVSVTPTVANPLVYVGDVTLPTTGYPDEAAAGIATEVSITQPGTDTSTFNDVLLLDTRGQTIYVDGTATAKKYAWADAPDPTTGIGGIYSGTTAGRTDALSVAASLKIAAALLLNPGNSRVLLFSPSGLLTATLTYSPRWLQEATQ